MRKNKRPDFKDEKFRKYREALQWVFTDHKVETMDIKRDIHTAMKLVNYAPYIHSDLVTDHSVGRLNRHENQFFYK